MKKTILALSTTIAMSLAYAEAQPPSNPSDAPNAQQPSAPDLDRDIQIARSLTEASRQATVAANLTLTDTQANAFWPTYREYRTQVAKQNDRFVTLVRQYHGDYDKMTDKDAKQLTATYLDIAQKRLDLKKSYVKKFEKALPAALVARAMQIEQKLDAMQDFTIARTIPLVPPAAGS